MSRMEASTARLLTNEALSIKESQHVQSILDNTYGFIEQAAKKGASIVQNIFDSKFYVSTPITNNIRKKVIEHLERMGYSIILRNPNSNVIKDEEVDVIW